MQTLLAIDVGCEFVVDRAGLTDGSAPAFSLVYNDGERLTVDARDASLTTRFKTRPALCEYGNNNATCCSPSPNDPRH